MARSKREPSNHKPEVENVEELEEGEIVEHGKDDVENEDLEEAEKRINDGSGDPDVDQPTSTKKGKGSKAKGKKAEDKSGQSTAKEAADKAIFTGEFVWEVKPDPYEGNLRRQNENQDVCERRIFKDIRKAYAKSTEKTREEQGEVEIIEFQWHGYEVHWEKFLQIDWDAERRFENSQIPARLKTKKEARVKELQEANSLSKDKAIQEPPLKARQMALAQHYLALDVDKDKDGFGKAYPKNDKGKKKSANLLEPKAQLDIVDGKLICEGEDADKKQWWSGLERTFDQYMGKDPKKYPQDDKTQSAHSTQGILIKIVSAWKGWRADIKANRVYQTKLSQIVSDDVDDLSLLRRTPKDKITVLVDKKDKLIAFLVPEAIQDAFKHQPWVKERMEIDTMHFYKHIKKPKPQSDKFRTSGGKKSDAKGLGAEPPDTKTSDATAQSPKQHNYVGTDHYGHWHAIDGEEQPIVETSDSLQNTAGTKQVLLHYLENTGGVITKLLDFWFGVWDSKLREEYREVYRRSPKFARLPPTNEDRPETYSLRIYDINTDRNVYKDAKDWVGGLTGLVHLGEFEGGQLCLPDLGLCLDGYQSGALLLFRGGLEHYVTSWNSTEGYRYTFEHTTHERTRQVVLGKEPYPPYVPPEFPEGEEPVGAVKLQDEGETGTTPTKEPKGMGKGAKGKGRAATGTTQKSKTKKDEGDEPEQEAEEDEDIEVSASTSAAAGKVKAITSKTKALAPTTKASTSKTGKCRSPRSSSLPESPPLRRSPRITTPSPKGITKPPWKSGSRSSPKSPSFSGSPPLRRSPRTTTPPPRGTTKPTKGATGKVKETTGKPKAASPTTHQPEKTPPLRRSPRTTTPPRGIAKPTKAGTGKVKESKSKTKAASPTTNQPAKKSSLHRSPRTTTPSPRGITKPTERSGSRRGPKSSSSTSSSKKSTSKPATRSNSRAQTPSSSSGGPPGKPATRSRSRAKTSSSSSNTPLMTKRQKKRRADQIAEDNGDDGKPTSSPKRGKRPKLDDVSDEETERDQGDDDNESAEDDGDEQDGEEGEDGDDEVAESDQDQQSDRSEQLDEDVDEDATITKSQDNSESARSSEDQENGPKSVKKSTWWLWGYGRDTSTGTSGGHPSQASKAPVRQDNVVDVGDDDDGGRRRQPRAGKRLPENIPDQSEDEDDDQHPAPRGKHPPFAGKHPQYAGKQPPEHIPDATPSDEEDHPRGYAVKRQPEEDEGAADDEEPDDDLEDLFESPDDDEE